MNEIYGKREIALSLILICALVGLFIGAVATDHPVARANEVWSVPMTASTATEGSNSNLEFGTNISATDGYDSEIDIPQPPQGPGATFDAYFEITDPLFPQLYKDYRGPSDGIEWTLHVESNSEVITLTWDVTSVPEDVSLHMNNGGLDIDMKAVNSTSLAAVSLIIHTGGGGGRGGGGGGGLSSPTEPTKPLEEPEEPAEPVVPEPKPTPTPSAPPPALEELGGPSGLAPGAWVGIGIGTALLLALVVWLILRRWVWAAAHREDS